MKQASVKTSRSSRKGAGAQGAETGANLLPQEGSAPTKDQLAMGGAYEGAKRFTQELMNWHVRNGSADMDLLPDKNMIDARAKDTIRNDAYADNGIEKYKDSVVGSKFSLNANPNIDYLKRKDKRLDDVWLEEFQEEVEARWELGAESGGNYIDAQRTKTATEIIRLGLAMQLIQGEHILSSEWIRRSRRPFRTAFLAIDPTRLDDPGVEYPTGSVSKNIRKGVRFNANSEPVGYFIANEHPHDYYPTFLDMSGRQFQYVAKETPWGRKNIHHGFEEKRVGQSRGVAKFVSSLKEMRMGQNFRDIMLQNAVTQASYAAAIESELPTAEVYEMLTGSNGGELSPEAFAQALEGFTGGFLGALSEYLKLSNGTIMNGVKIPHLFPGTKLNVLTPSKGGPLGTDFEKSIMRYIAASLNISYEQLTGDFSGVNYSTLKGAINETQKHMEVVKRNSAESTANFMYSNWLEEQIVTGQITSMPSGYPEFWEDMNRDAYSQATWFSSGRGQIEEVKETQAASLRLKANLSTLEDESARLGKDWRKVLAQIARERAYAKKLGIDLNFEDNAINALSGAARSKDPNASTNDDEE